MSEPTIIIGGDVGFHNRDMKRAEERLKRGKQYRDLSTICVVPTRGLIHARVVESWMGLLTPMNNAFIRIFVQGMEVADAYNAAVDMMNQDLLFTTCKPLGWNAASAQTPMGGCGGWRFSFAVALDGYSEDLAT